MYNKSDIIWRLHRIFPAINPEIHPSACMNPQSFVPSGVLYICEHGIKSPSSVLVHVGCCPVSWLSSWQLLVLCTRPTSIWYMYCCSLYNVHCYCGVYYNVLQVLSENGKTVHSRSVSKAINYNYSYQHMSSLNSFLKSSTSDIFGTIIAYF